MGNVIEMFMRDQIDRRERDEMMQLKAENRMLKAKMERGRFFTPEQLKEHDKAVAKQGREAAEQFLKKYARDVEAETNRNTDAYIEERKAIFKDPDTASLLLNLQCYALHFCVETLTKDFGWKVPPNQNYADMRYSICKFVAGVGERTMAVAADTNADIVMDAEKSAKIYGLAFKVEEE